MSDCNPRLNDPNIVLLCLDTLRKDAYEKYAPRLSELATVEFEEMRAMASWSVPSHTAMLTGRLASETGVHAYQRRADTISRDKTLFDDLNGYRTVGVSANVYASSVFAFDSFFDSFTSISPSRRFPEGMDIQEYLRTRESSGGVRSWIEFLNTVGKQPNTLQSLLNGAVFKLEDALLKSPLPVKKPFDYGGKAVARSLIREIDASEEPVFAFANFMDIHGPHAPFRNLNPELYDCPRGFNTLSYDDTAVNASEQLGEYEAEIETMRTLYRAEVDYLDRLVSDTVETIQRQTDRDTVFIVTADHGENLGYEADGYLLNHISSMSEALLHVPFDVISPRHARESITDLTSHEALRDIVRTIRTGGGFFRHAQDVAYAEIVGAGGAIPDDEDERYWDRGIRVAYAEGRKYVVDELGEQRVFDISEGASQETELLDVEFRDDLFERFGEWVEGESGDEDISPAAADRLKDLGYV